jgi:5-methylcytosine-specific restriction protein A
VPFSPPVHRPIGSQSDAERRAAYAAAHPSRSGIYGHRWRKLRALFLSSHPLCACGCGYAATVVDHKQPHHGDPVLLYAWDNLEAMTKACHDRKTAARDGGFGNPVRRW